MTFDDRILLARLAEAAEVAGRPFRYVIGFSGGLDSTVLTHALALSRDRHRVPLTAVYVDHGLAAESDGWREHCRAFAAARDIDFTSLGVTVDTQSGTGLEAAAREARYAALRDLLEPGDWLLSAHHQDDQAETVLLNLMRSSGPAGLAGISSVRKFAAGWLVRPLLEVPRRSLQDYARSHGLESVADPSNLDQQFDRNYLRHEVLPRFELRWPDAAKRIRRSATLAREAATLLADLARVDQTEIGDRPDRLSITGLQQLRPERQRNLLRHVIHDLGLPMPGAVHLENILSDLVAARNDAQPLVAWPGVRVRRYRDRLYIMPADDPDTVRADSQPVSGDRVVLPGGLGTLVLEPKAEVGLSERVMAADIEVRYRGGGEEINVLDQKHTKKLKKLLQDEGVVPWMRDRLPLLYADGELVAVADLWLAHAAASRPGTAIRWRNRPPIH